MLEIALILLLLGSPVCSMDTPLVRTPSYSTVVLGQFSGRAEEVPVPQVVQGRGAIPDSVSSVVGYEFEVIQASGREELPTGSRVVIVPWNYDPSCATTVWRDSSWAVASEPVVLLLRERRTGRETPTFDVLGLHSPYPNAAMLEFRVWPAPPADRSEWLRPDEYFDLVSRLPLIENRFTYPRWSEEGEAVFAEGPERWRTTFPGSEILRRFRER